MLRRIITSVLTLAMTAPALATGINFPNDVPYAEISLAGQLPLVGPSDGVIGTLGDASGTVLVVMLQEYELRSARSIDGGATFGAEVIVAGATTPEVIQASVTQLAGSSTAYAALQIADPQGDIGLQVVRTDNLGQTWNSPVDLVRRGDATHGVWSVGLAAGPGNRVAVAYMNRDDRHTYAQVSTDGGATWSVPVRLDTLTASEDQTLADAPAVLIDGSGNVHVAFEVNPPTTATAQVFVTRSTDNGATFSPQQSFGSCSPALLQGQESPSLALASDGNLLLSVFENGFDFVAGPTEKLALYRSVDAGASYGCSGAPGVGLAASTLIHPVLSASPVDGTVLLGVIRSDGELRLHRSSDNGATLSTLTVPASATDAQVPRSINVGDTSGAFGFIARTDAAVNSPVSFLPRIERTPNGTWTVAFDSEESGAVGAGAGLLTDGPRMLRSSDDGVTFVDDTRISSVAAGASIGTLGGVTSSGADAIFAAWSDGRSDGGLSFDVFGNRADAATLSFVGEARVDAVETTGDANRQCLNQPTVVAEGNSNVYVAFDCLAPQAGAEVYLSVSTDRGQTFGTPIQVSRPPAAAGTRLNLLPVLAATADGDVYVVYASEVDDPVDGRVQQLRFNRSTDGGQTWLNEDVLLDVQDSIPPYDIAADEGGAVYIAWASEDEFEVKEVLLVRSDDSGASRTLSTVAVADRPLLCAQEGTNGQQVILTYVGDDPVAGDSTLYARVSEDGGASFGPQVDLIDDPADTVLGTSWSLACDGTDKAILAWSRSRLIQPLDFEIDARATRFDGTAWQPAVTTASQADLALQTGDVAYTDSGELLITLRAAEFIFDPLTPFDITALTQRVYATTSNDGGATFVGFQRLDDGSPKSGRAFSYPRIATDGAGNAWVSWEDTSAGAGAIAVRASDDGGTTFGPVQRLNRETPQGARENRISGIEIIYPRRGAALPGGGPLDAAAWFAWGGQRDSRRPDTLINRIDAAGGSSGGLPGEALSLSLSNAGGGQIQLDWTADCGAGDAYGIYRGNLAGGYASIQRDSCSVAATTATLAEIPSTDEFFLVVPSIGGSEGSYGNTSTSAARVPAGTVCFPQLQIDACAN